MPFYRDELLPTERVALQQCFKVLCKHDIIAIKPKSLLLPAEVTRYLFHRITTFDDSFFAGVKGYNRLMLSAGFYNAFINYEYILIYQLDAFVFKDELLYWCEQGFDYIGAPWIGPKRPNILKSFKIILQSYYYTRFNIQVKGLPSLKQVKYKVGNGGFSLRRTEIFGALCVEMADKIAEYNKRDSFLFNEDVFWSIEVNRKHKMLKIPEYKKALEFSFELHPKTAFQINNNRLPFGCHDWDLKIEFWRPIFKDAGYNI